jgi:hypothetical protein
MRNLNIHKLGSDPMLDAAKGIVTGQTCINKFGSNPEVTSNTFEDVWDAGGTYTFPSTADITHIRQAVDQADMQGEDIEVQGLDINWDLVTQSVTLDAANTTTPVALGTPLLRVFRMKVTADVVTDQLVQLRNVGGGTTYATIQAGFNQTLMAIYSVPANKTAYITNYYCDYVRDAVKDPDGVDYDLLIADRANSYEFQVKHQKGIPKQASGFQHEFQPYLVVTEKSDIKIRSFPSNANANVHAGFDIILVDK